MTVASFLMPSSTSPSDACLDHVSTFEVFGHKAWIYDDNDDDCRRYSVDVLVFGERKSLIVMSLGRNLVAEAEAEFRIRFPQLLAKAA